MALCFFNHRKNFIYLTALPHKISGSYTSVLVVVLLFLSSQKFSWLLCW